MSDASHGQTKPSLDLAAVCLIAVLCALWGTNQVAIKLTNGGISPILQAGLRSLGAAVLLLCWARLRGIRLFAHDRTLAAGLLAGAMFAGEFALLYGALLYTSAARAVLFLYTSPFFVALGGHLLLPAERLRPLQIAGLAAAFCGLIVAFADRLAGPSGTALLGDVMAIAAGAAWGATTVVIKASPLARVSADKTLAYQLVVSAVALPILSLLFHERGVFAVTPTVIALMAFQIVIVAFASYLAWFWLVKHYPAARVAAFTFLTPLFGVGAGFVLLGEPVSWALAFALALVAAGIYLVNRPTGTRAS